MEILTQAWPWYVAGPLIAINMAVLIYFGKRFGLSSNFRTMCSIAGAGKFAEFFRFDWKKDIWNLMVVIGAIIGGFLVSEYLSSGELMDLNPDVVAELKGFGIENPGEELVPVELFSLDQVFTLKGFLLMVVGGFLVGFGTRWAGGCTSGHAISGLSDLQLPSLIAVIGFFIGGIITTYFLLPIILNL